jgi:hypothetical protein
MEAAKSFKTGETVDKAMEPEHCEATEPAMEAEEDTKNTMDTLETTEVCKFYLENKCRFGDECRNMHEGAPVEKVVKNDKSKKKTVGNKTDKSKKKPPMKTADDAIKRLQWDPMLSKVNQQYMIIESKIFMTCLSKTHP